MRFIKRAYDKIWNHLLQKLQQLVTPDPDLQQRIHDSLCDTLKKQGIFVPEMPSDGCQHQYCFSNSYCCRPRLNGSNLCLWHHHSTEKYQTEIVTHYFGEPLTFKEAIEREVKSGGSLSGAYLEEAKLGGGWYHPGVDLQGADLRSANIRKAHLSYGSLQGANLAMANLELAFLSDVDLNDAVMTSAKLFMTKFRNNNFSRVKGIERTCFRDWKCLIPKYQMLEEHPEQAEPMYRALMVYFVSMGALDDASWATYRYRLMRHAILKKRLSPLHCIIEALFQEYFHGKPIDVHSNQIAVRRIVESIRIWISSLVEFLISWLNHWIWGYGEKPMRIMAFSVAIIACYAALYDANNMLMQGDGFLDSLYFSTVTFTTLGYGDLTPKHSFRLFAASEALVGLLLSGLFLFSLSRRAIGRA